MTNHSLFDRALLQLAESITFGEVSAESVVAADLERSAHRMGTYLPAHGRRPEGLA